jgi:hypothetical protein
MTDFINDYKKFLVDIKSIEKDSLKIKSTINQVSKNESIRDILGVLKSIFFLLFFSKMYCPHGPQ